LLNCPFSPRALIAQLFALICATSSPGTIRNKSGMFVAPDRRMSSCVITNTATAVRDNVCSLFETDVTSIFIRSSRLTFAKSSGFGCASCARATAHKLIAAIAAKCLAQARIPICTLVLAYPRLHERRRTQRLPPAQIRCRFSDFAVSNEVGKLSITAALAPPYQTELSLIRLSKMESSPFHLVARSSAPLLQYLCTSQFRTRHAASTFRALQSRQRPKRSTA
jgi:hypothetical protein